MLKLIPKHVYNMHCIPMHCSSLFMVNNAFLMHCTTMLIICNIIPIHCRTMLIICCATPNHCTIVPIISKIQMHCIRVLIMRNCIPRHRTNYAYHLSNIIPMQCKMMLIICNAMYWNYNADDKHSCAMYWKGNVVYHMHSIPMHFSCLLSIFIICSFTPMYCRIMLFINTIYALHMSSYDKQCNIMDCSTMLIISCNVLPMHCRTMHIIMHCIVQDC